MVGYLPRELEVAGKQYAVRTDFRDILKILVAFNDPELEDSERVYICLFILYEDFQSIPVRDYEAAFKAALSFIDQGAGEIKKSAKRSPRVMDWEQDENLIFPAVNKVAGFETRSAEYIHWWTFLGYYMEVSEGIFSTVLSLRMKKAKGKKLEKWEREFWAANKDLCVLHEKLTEEEKAAKERLNALLE